MSPSSDTYEGSGDIAEGSYPLLQLLFPEPSTQIPNSFSNPFASAPEMDLQLTNLSFCAE